MTKQELTTLLRSVGVNENTITAMENAYDMGVEQGKEHCCLTIQDNIPRSGHDTKEYVFAFKLINAIKQGEL